VSGGGEKEPQVESRRAASKRHPECAKVNISKKPASGPGMIRAGFRGARKCWGGGKKNGGETEPRLQKSRHGNFTRNVKLGQKRSKRHV